MSKDSQPDVAQAGSLGFALVISILVFTGLGYLLDRWLHTGPWLMVGGVFVGFVLGFTYVVLVAFARASRPGARGRTKRGDQGGRIGGRTS
jgi:ATP synthase protein I